MRRSLSIALVLLAATVARADPNVSLRLDRQRIAVGDSVELTVTVAGEQNVPAPDTIPVPDGLEVDYRGQSTSVSFVNGQMSSSASHAYVITPTRAGVYRIGPVQITAGGHIVDAGSVRLVVTAGQKADDGAAGEETPLRLVAEVSSQRVYLHEPLTLTLRLEVRGIRVSDLQYPSVTADGFSVRGFGEPAQRRERRAGGIVDVVEFTTEIVPVRSGRVPVGPTTMQMNVVMNDRGDPFFGSMFARRRPRTVTAEPIEVEVLPIPTAGRPASFSGAVGRFSLDVTAQPAAVAAGDPVTLGVTVRGSGSLAQAAPPSVPATDGLKLYPPTESQGTDAGQGVVTRRFEQVVIPERPGVVTIPAIEFAYFDPAAERFVTERGPEVVVTVSPRTTAAPDVVVGAPAPRVEPKREELGRDIVFIKDDPGTLRPIGTEAHHTFWFWLLQLVPLALLAGVVTWDRRRERLGGDPRLARFAGAGAAAKRAIAAASDPDAVARAYVEYLAAKLDLAPGAVTPDVVRSRLASAGVGEVIVADAADLLAASEHDRYRPAATADAAPLRERAARIVAALERERRIVLPVALLAVLLAGAAIAHAADVDAPKTLFFRGNTLYADGHFEEAAAAWEQILASGLESGPLHFNVGNARLRAGDRGRAVLAYERAWRLIPGDADLAANLRFAKEDADPTEGMSLAARLAFPLATRAATSRLVAWAVAAYWVLVFALVAARLAPATRRAARVVAFTSAVALVLSATGGVYRHLRVDAPDWAVVLRDAEVRFEPSESGTVHYEAPVGTVVEVVGGRDDWAQVERRSDGLRGWIERSAVEALRADRS